jgi:gluconolactonase
VTQTSVSSTDDATRRGFVVRAAGMAAVIGDAPVLARVIDVDAHEGPVYVASEDALYFTSVPAPATGSADHPAVAVKRLALDGLRFPLGAERVSVLTDALAAANGMTLGHDGSLLVCEQGGPQRPATISRLDRITGRVDVLVDSWQDFALNSPNDVAAKSDGTVWFTDPSYGYLQGFRPPPACGDHVYCHDPATGETRAVAQGVDKPNGIAFSPDERVLYVTDSGANQEAGSFHPDRPHHVLAFDVHGGQGLSSGRVFAVVEPGIPDGLKVDSDGRVYVSSGIGVQIFAPDGERLGHIAMPGVVNFTFGGADRNVLFMTTDTAVWAAVLAAQGG